MTPTPTADGRRAAAIPDHRIVDRPAELVRPGDVTLYGVVLYAHTVGREGEQEVLLHCWGHHTVTSWPGTDVTVICRVSPATLRQLRDQAPR